MIGRVEELSRSDSVNHICRPRGAFIIYDWESGLELTREAGKI